MEKNNEKKGGREGGGNMLLACFIDAMFPLPLLSISKTSALFTPPVSGVVVCQLTNKTNLFMLYVYSKYNKNNTSHRNMIVANSI